MSLAEQRAASATQEEKKNRALEEDADVSGGLQMLLSCAGKKNRMARAHVELNLITGVKDVKNASINT